MLEGRFLCKGMWRAEGEGKGNLADEAEIVRISFQ